MPTLVGTYKLSTINGKKPAHRDSMSIEFAATGEENKYRVHARCANTLNGSVTYADGALKGTFMSTMMMGPPDQMEVERILGKGFHEGLNVKHADNVLTLSFGNDVIVYKSA